MATTFGVPAADLREDTSPEAIPAWDSLNHLTLVLAIETEFGIQLAAGDVLQMRNLASIRQLLRDRGVQI